MEKQFQLVRQKWYTKESNEDRGTKATFEKRYPIAVSTVMGDESLREKISFEAMSKIKYLNSASVLGADHIDPIAILELSMGLTSPLLFGATIRACKQYLWNMIGSTRPKGIIFELNEGTAY